jgi:small conductance mechanosensitive channel
MDAYENIDLESTADLAMTWLLTHGLRIVIILLLTFLALLLARWVTNRIFSAIKETADDYEDKKRADTLRSIVRYALRLTILVLATVVVLGELGIQIGPILAAAGIVGLAVGFGSQQLVQDVIAGFFILFEDQIRVGDVVNIAGKGGVVERVSLRMTILRDAAGNVHYVRNGHIDVVTNMTKEFSQYVFDIGVAYREDTDEVFEVIKQVGAEVQGDPEYADDILDPIEILGVDSFADSAVVIKARIKTKPIKQWRVGREFNRRLKKAFDERNIEIPFPHMTVYMGADKQGQAPPLNISNAEK